jgi:hypothetical protein
LAREKLEMFEENAVGLSQGKFAKWATHIFRSQEAEGHQK